MSSECFDLSIDGHVAHLVMKRADAMNTLTPAFWSELPAIVRELDDGGEVRALVISSTGKHFTAGMDLQVFASGLGVPSGIEVGRQREAVRRLVLLLQDSFNALERARFPVIAAVQGGCIGGGVDMISACDIRYCSADAFFVVQETNLGMVADVGTLQRLPHLIPQGWVRELAFTGERLPATKAKELGLVNEVFESHQAVVAHALSVAKTIATKSPLTITGTKQMITYARDHSVPDALDYVATWQSGMFQQHDVAAAMAARASKTEARFEGLAKKAAMTAPAKGGKP